MENRINNYPLLGLESLNRPVNRMLSLVFSLYIPACLALSLVFSNLAFGNSPQSEFNSVWSLGYKSDQFSIYTKPYSEATSLNKTKTNSEFLEVKSKVIIHAPIERVLNYFKGQNGCWEWQLKCKSSTILEKINDHKQIVYTVVNMPWPLTDRDFMFEAQIKDSAQDPQSQKNRTVLITLTPFSNPEKYNKHSTKYVSAESYIQYLISESAQTTTLNIYMHTEFGGSISPSLINGRLVETLQADIDALLGLIVD